MAVISLVARINAQSAEFEKTFSKASQTAAQFEKQYGALASSVSAHQARINKAFQSFSGDKIIAEANEYASAIARVGGAAKLTESEQRRVNASVTEAIAKYRALGQDAPAGLLALAKATQTVAAPTSHANKLFTDLGTQVKATALGFIGAQAVIGGVQTAFRTLTQFVGSSVDSFAAAEAAQQKLTTAMSAQGLASPAAIKQADALSSAFQRTTVYSDDLITEMQALLVQVGNVMPSAMRGALTAATNLASGLGVDLRTATMLVGKAFAGETGTLKRYGIVIDEAKVKAEGMPAVLEAINAKFGGQASAAIETYSGKVQQLTNDWDNFKESVGGAIVLNPTLIALLNLMTKSAGAGGGLAGGLSSFADLGMGQSAGNVVRLLDAYSASINRADKAAKDAVALVKFPEVVADSWKSAIPPSIADTVRGIAAAYKPLTEEQKKSAEAAKKHADAIQQLNACFVDAQRVLIPLTSAQGKLVTHYLSMNLSVSDITAKMKLGTREVQAWATSIEAMNRVTKQAIPLINRWQEDLGRSADHLTPMIRLIDREWPRAIKNVNASLGVVGDFAPKIGNTADSLKDLSLAFSHMSQIAGESFSSITSGLGGVVSAINTAQTAQKSINTGMSAWSDGSKLTGLLSIASGWLAIVGAAAQAGVALRPLLGLRHGKLGDALGTNLDGRQMIRDFAETMGGFRALQTKLVGLGQAEYDRLWKMMNDVGQSNKKQAAEAIAEISTVLSGTPEAIASSTYQTRDDLQKVADKAKAVWDYMVESGKYTAAQIANAFQQSKDAQVTALGETASVASQALKDLDAQITSLQQSIANEAPEEIMGIIEQQTRAQIDAIVQQRDAAQLALDQTANHAVTAAEAAAKAITDTLAAHDFVARIKVYPEYVGFPDGFTFPSVSVPALAHGGIVRRPTLALVGEAGPEAVVPLSKMGNLSRGGENINVTLVMPDGEVLLRQVVKAKRRLGL